MPLIDYLCREIPLASAAYLRLLIRNGKIRVNEIPVTAETLLRAGDSVLLPGSQKLTDLIRSSDKLPKVLYESEQVLIVHKPDDIATHAGRGHENDNLAARVEALLASRGAIFRSAPIHRLDRPTSGPVIFGKGQKAISELGKMMQEEHVEKRYLALTTAGLPNTGMLEGFVPGKGKLKAARTEFRVIEQQAGLALIELRLQTGRQHQIRRQLATAGHPVAGDNRYRGPQLPGVDRLFLHCHQLDFTSPFSGERVTINDPLPAGLKLFLTTAGFTYTNREETAAKQP